MYNFPIVGGAQNLSKIKYPTWAWVMDRFRKYNKLEVLYVPWESNISREIFKTMSPRESNKLGGIYGHKESNRGHFSIIEASCRITYISILKLRVNKYTTTMLIKTSSVVARLYLLLSQFSKSKIAHKRDGNCINIIFKIIRKWAVRNRKWTKKVTEDEE